MFVSYRIYTHARAHFEHNKQNKVVINREKKRIFELLWYENIYESTFESIFLLCEKSKFEYSSHNAENISTHFFLLL